MPPVSDDAVFKALPIRRSGPCYHSHDGTQLLSDGYCLLTVVHDRLEESPITAESMGGEGWMLALSGLKTALETGQPLHAK